MIPSSRLHEWRPAHVALIASGALLAIVAISLTQSIATTNDLGIDAAFYRGVGARWLADGSYYLPRQLAGTYHVALMVDVVYPPSALLLFVPAYLLPWPLWWAVPIVVTAYIIACWRPTLWSVSAMFLLLAWPRATGAFLFGNTDMWAMTGVAAGLRWGWPAVLLTLKPTFAPLALIGMRRRSWWFALAGLVVLGLATLPMWQDYVTSMRNLQVGADYSVGSLPLLSVPLVGWVARTRAPS